MNILNKKYIHFIGIGGIGVSSLAHILHNKGIKISGSDNVSSDITEEFKRQKVKIFDEHKKSNISTKHDLIVYSPAIPLDNPEMVHAKELKIERLSYPQALGELTKHYYTIAIAGSHGKSTTTAMTALIAQKGGLDPTVVIGTKIKEFGNKNFRVGNSNYLIIEACEYRDSFLNFYPNLLIITNIDADHLDYFKNAKNYLKSFKALAKKVSLEGAIVIDIDALNTVKAVKGIKAKVYTMTEKSKKADFTLKGNTLNINSPLNNLNKKSEQRLKIRPKVVGKFNINNASLAAIASLILGIENKNIEQAVAAFGGTWRRMEYRKVDFGKTKVIDDYGHHPTEIKTTLKAIRETNPKAKILCVFQPHQYHRTKMFLKDFGKSFSDVDEVIIPNIYKVRDSESDVKNFSAEVLVKEIKKHHKNVQNGNGLKNTANYLKKNYKKYDIIITMGAGDIDGIYGEI